MRQYELAELKGTEKQIAWAEDIRKEFIEKFEEELGNEISKLKVYDRVHLSEQLEAKRQQTLANLAKAAECFVRGIKKIDTAKFWIDAKVDGKIRVGTVSFNRLVTQIAKMGRV